MSIEEWTRRIDAIIDQLPPPEALAMEVRNAGALAEHYRKILSEPTTKGIK